MYICMRCIHQEFDDYQMLQMFDHFSLMVPQNLVKEELPDSPKKPATKPTLCNAEEPHATSEALKRTVPTPCRAVVPATKMSGDEMDAEPETTTAKKPATRQDMLIASDCNMFCDKSFSMERGSCTMFMIYCVPAGEAAVGSEIQAEQDDDHKEETHTIERAGVRKAVLGLWKEDRNGSPSPRL